MSLPPPWRRVASQRAGSGGGPAAPRALPEEVAVALVYDGTTQAVMMATPADLEDFAIGFSLTEGIVTRAAGIGELELVAHAAGIEARMWLDAGRAQALADRRRAMTGPVGCGLCGIDSLDQALRPIPPLPPGGPRLTAAEIAEAMAALARQQKLHDATRAVHAAGFWQPGRGLVALREDVGRHNALDKLAGALARAGIDGGTGAVLLTSRVSVEMVQKTAAIGARLLIAVSAPTAHAVRLADGAGITLAAHARGATCDLYTHPDRINMEAATDVA
jgi:FdhD protein